MLERHFSNFVLVIDDEPGITRLCSRLLERANFQVQAVTNSAEGIAVLEKEPVHLLLVDIRMPVIDGFQVIDQARQRQPDLAVVVMTGFGTVETAIEALRRGADGLILKPFSGAELVQSVKQALQERQHKQDVVRLQTLRPLFTITESLFTETDPVRLQELVLDIVCGQLHCSCAGFYRRSDTQPGYLLFASRGELASMESDDPDCSVLGRAEAWSMPILVNREGPGEPDLQAFMAERGFTSVIAAPLVTMTGTSTSGKTNWGLLQAARLVGEARFRESDLEIFAILARQVAVALENARLHAELRAYIRQVEESQRALIQAEKMAIAGRLTASIAHEINNPLQSVQNCLHLAVRRELSTEDRQNYLDMAQTEMERLMNTVHRMLDYYRPSAVDRKAVELNTLIQRVLALTARQLEERQIKVEMRLASKMPAVLAVGDQIQQVMLNLVLNAMEAMPQGGKLLVETRYRKDIAEVTVEDTGPGVSLSERDHIFEPFISTKDGGTGLGLAVSYGIMAAHGGSLDLISGRGRGACFRISLPAGDGI